MSSAVTEYGTDETADNSTPAVTDAQLRRHLERGLCNAGGADRLTSPAALVGRTLARVGLPDGTDVDDLPRTNRIAADVLAEARDDGDDGDDRGGVPDP